jgi:hypothetical protein
MPFPSPDMLRGAYRAATGMPVPNHSMARSAVMGRQVAKGIRRYRGGLAAGALGLGALAAGTHGLRRRPSAPVTTQGRGRYSSGIYKY